MEKPTNRLEEIDNILDYDIKILQISNESKVCITTQLPRYDFANLNIKTIFDGDFARIFVIFFIRPKFNLRSWTNF